MKPAQVVSLVEGEYMNAPKRAENTITEFYVNQRNLVGDAAYIGRYNLLGVVMVGLSKS